jgi:hypothetical protein
VSSPKPAGLAIAGVSLVVLIGAVAYSKRSADVMVEPTVSDPELASH